MVTAATFLRNAAMPREAAQARSNSALGLLRKELVPLLLMLILLGAARDSLANHYRVPSGSMQPTLMPGDRVVVDMRAYGLRLPFTNKQLLAVGQPQRGDVAVFDSPADGTRLIKRIVAAAGDSVQLHAGHLSVNGVPLRLDSATESIAGRRVPLDLDMGGGPDIAGLTIPEGKLLVLGDHRGNSFDGRFFGLIDADKVYGKALRVYYRRDQGFAWQRL